MTEPTGRDEYLERFAKNQRIEGFGFDTTTVYPCPFCAAADWAKHRIIEMEEVMVKPHKCSECQRSAKMIFNRDAGSVIFEFVQCGGPDQPEWLVPHMRRVPDED